jgi:hypothetical protein
MLSVNDDWKSSVKSLVYVFILSVLKVYFSLVYINKQIITCLKKSQYDFLFKPL